MRLVCQDAMGRHGIARSGPSVLRMVTGMMEVGGAVMTIAEERVVGLARRARQAGDAAHHAAAVRAAGGGAVDRSLIACGRIDGGFRLGGGVGGDQTATKGEVVAAVAIGEEAIVADAGGSRLAGHGIESGG